MAHERQTADLKQQLEAEKAKSLLQHKSLVRKSFRLNCEKTRVDQLKKDLEDKTKKVNDAML